MQDGAYASVLEATSAQVVEWVTSMPFSAQLASLFPITDSSKMTEDMYAVREQQVLQECQEAFAAVQHFENTHGLVLSNMSTGYVQQRPVLISRLLDLSSKLGLRDEVVHDAVLLMDRTASQVGGWVERAQAEGHCPAMQREISSVRPGCSHFTWVRSLLTVLVRSAA